MRLTAACTQKIALICLPPQCIIWVHDLGNCYDQTLNWSCIFIRSLAQIKLSMSKTLCSASTTNLSLWLGSSILKAALIKRAMKQTNITRAGWSTSASRVSIHHFDKVSVATGQCSPKTVWITLHFRRSRSSQYKRVLGTRWQTINNKPNRGCCIPASCGTIVWAQTTLTWIQPAFQITA